MDAENGAGDASEASAERVLANRERAKQNLRALASRHARSTVTTARVATPQSTSKATSEAPLPRDKALGDYIEFDLTRLRNSKGGFLLSEKEGENAEQALEDMRKEREREKQRLRDQMEPGITLDPTTRPLCEMCKSSDILYDPFQRVFNVFICRNCERAHPEKYSLLTKTEVKQDYLLTDAELADGELLPHLLKKNPLKSTYSSMMLFLRGQVEQFAFSDAKWGSAEGLDAEYHQRNQERAKKRSRKFNEGLVNLRKRTIRGNIWQQRRDNEHQHTWEPVPGSAFQQQCPTCGQQTVVEEL